MFIFVQLNRTKYNGQFYCEYSVDVIVGLGGPLKVASYNIYASVLTRYLDGNIESEKY